MADLSKIGKRDELRPRAGDEPHWQRLRAGCFLGYRPSKREGRGTWFARTYDADAGKYRRKALGSYREQSGNDVFAQAKRDAEEWAESVESGGVRAEKVETVAAACRAYKAKGNDVAALARLVHSDPIADVKLDKLRRHHLEAWRTRLTGSAATINRYLVPLRAALRRVKVEGAPGTDAAWQEALRPTRGADRRRTLYLDRQERQRLLDAVSPEARPYLRALCMLPLRPGAVSALTAGDFDKRTRTLTVGKDKNGNPRQIHLPQGIGGFMEAQCKDKLPGAPMFARSDGAPWDRNTWKNPIRQARETAKLPPGVTAYVLRHCVLTDLATAGVPLLTIAQLADTSVAMIERHYGHLTATAAAEALDKIAL